MNKKILIPIVLLALIAAAFFFWRRDDQEGGAIVLYGNVDIREVELAFRSPGRLASLAFDEGTNVKAGDLLAEIDAAPYRDALAAATANVQSAEAELAKLRHGSRPQEVRRAEAALHQAEAVAAKVAADLTRQEGLAATGAASQKVLEAARSAQAESAAAVAAAQQTLSLQKEGFRSEDIAVAEARLASAQAVLAQAQTALDDTRLLAPSDATISSRLREVGSMVSSRDAIYTLSLRDPTYVRAYVSEKDLGRIAPGQKVRVKTDSSSKVYAGKVGFIAPKAEFTPKAVETTDLRTALVYRLRVIVDESGDGLRQGMPVTVEVDSPPADAAAQEN